MKDIELKQAVKALREAECNVVADELQNILKSSNSSDIQLIDRNSYIATILWCEEDIKSALLNYGHEPTTENINAVLAELDVSNMEDCESGWLEIGYAIGRAGL